MKLEEAIAKAALVTFEGMLISHVEQDGVINIGAVSQDGLGYSIDLLANQEITIGEDGTATVPDLDGVDAILTFYVPMTR